MYNTNPYAAYKNQDLDTIGNNELVGRLLGAAAICVKTAVLDIGEKRLDKASSNLIKSQSIISALKSALDMNYEVATGMNSLYDYMLKRLAEANMKKDTEILNEVAGILVQLRDAWNEAVKKFRISQGSGSSFI